ncbi:MAG: SRPBCC family protein [Actinobacteria bacterium]|nr:SRPBCC family protein [Actinomycetota bacterium]NIS35308.1 SRPBCC family protein [Actinomycetota bacterium]NIT98055.1 SRPBCC family protein [Actinomycetota bacterium]NIU21687.1 SRPBCC family protein [Actinomycetota bacterium]NIU70012.1 SRPBCC family protein [Actinomycetota bacterium]
MAEIAEKTSIARSPEQVWAALADFGGISRWAPNVDHSCLTTGQHEGVGSVRRVQVGRNALLERVVEWEPGLHLGYRIEGLPPVVRSAVNTWRITGSGEATTVTLTSRIDAGPRPPQQVVARVFGRVLARSSRQMLAGLKAHVEAGAVS